MQQYDVTVRRMVVQETVISVRAENESDAETIALSESESVENYDWDEVETSRYEVVDIV